jgi:hypothetical protein
VVVLEGRSGVAAMAAGLIVVADTVATAAEELTAVADTVAMVATADMATAATDMAASAWDLAWALGTVTAIRAITGQPTMILTHMVLMDTPARTATTRQRLAQAW